jgi:hypothetical protein
MEMVNTVNIRKMGIHNTVKLRERMEMVKRVNLDKG